nr:delta-60 repeat domain-containing protein [Candidatus Gracilibacteria bacterium]
MKKILLIIFIILISIINISSSYAKTINYISGKYDIITSDKKTNKIKQIKVKNTDLNISNSRISAKIKGNTLITAKNSGSFVDTNNFGIIPLIQNSNKIQFEFGNTGSHLIFSNPVQIDISTPNIENGTLVKIKVKHYGDLAFNTVGLSTSKLSLCSTGGVATIEGNLGIVSNGKVTFYTCGASTFDVGVIDSSFLTTNGAVNAIAIQTDGKIVIGGAFTTVGGTTRNRVARLTTTGALDTTFNPNANNTVNTLAIQTNGSIVLGGAFTRVGGTTRNRIARITTAGALDTGFNPNANNTVNTLAIQTDGAIVFGGTFTTVGGILNTRNRIARVNSAGTLDNGFNPNANNTVNTLAIQTDGAIVFGGTFTTIGGLLGTTRNRIARVNSAGTLDNGFNPNANNTVNAIAIQNDGSVLIGGAFTTVGGTARNNIARVNTAGTLDTGFNPNASASVLSIKLQANQKILIGGTFTTVGGTARSYVARLNANGTVNTSFYPTITGTNVTALEIDSEENLIVGGTYTQVNGTARVDLARIGIKTVCLTIQGCNIWVNSNTGITQSASLVTGWKDLSGNDYNLTQTSSTEEPTYKNTTTDNINFNPIVYFDGASTVGDYMFLTGGTIGYGNNISNMSAYTIALPINNPVGSHSFFEAATNGRIGGGIGTGYLAGDFGGGDYRLSTTGEIITKPILLTHNVSVNGITADGDKRTLRVNGKKIIGNNSGSIEIGNGSTFSVGAIDGGAWSTQMNLAELLIYLENNDTVSQNEIESYLSIKYGITLDQTSPQNYINSSGAVIWNSTTNAGYNNNIFGIGRDDGFNLYQKQSKSINTDGLITIGNSGSIASDNPSNTTTFSANQSYMIIGDNMNNLEWTSSGAPIYTAMLKRIFKVQESGTVGNIKIQVPDNSSALTIKLPDEFTATGIVLLVDSDGNFTSGATELPMTLNGTNWEITTNLVNGQYFTFGFKDYFAPVLSSTSLMNNYLYPIGNFNTTFNYSDNIRVDIPSVNINLLKWASGSFSQNSNNYINTGSQSVTQTQAIYPISSLPYGKYQANFTLKDLAGNTTNTGIIFYVDELEMIISTGSIDIGNISYDSKKFSPEVTVTIKTVGAPFQLYMSQSGQLEKGSNIFINWNGVEGYGYDQSPYTNNISSIGSMKLIGSSPINLNPNGDKNINIYKIKLGALLKNIEQSYGLYQSYLNFYSFFNY